MCSSDLSSLAIAVGYADVTATLGGITLNQTGRAIECVLLLMLFYLVISLGISAIMNVYNNATKLKERLAMSDTHAQSVAFVRETTIPESPPPVTSSGIVGWMRQNLFATWANSLLTVAAIYVINLLLSSAMPWVFKIGRAHV